MRILSVNNYQTQNQQKQKISFESATFDSHSTARLVKGLIKIDRLDMFLKENNLPAIKGAGRCYIVENEGNKIIKDGLDPKDLMEQARSVTFAAVDEILKPVQIESSNAIKATAAIVDAEDAHQVAIKELARESSRENTSKVVNTKLALTQAEVDKTVAVERLKQEKEIARKKLFLRLSQINS